MLMLSSSWLMLNNAFAIGCATLSKILAGEKKKSLLSLVLLDFVLGGENSLRFSPY